MSKAEPSPVSLSNDADSTVWQTVQPFLEGSTRPKYEVKDGAEISQTSLEDDLVVVRRTSALDGRQNEYTIPKPVLSETLDILE
ncbi:hypothetical protein OB919_13480 [Halobacteria archaeon AArc-curdl1]|uniref:Uncharacterized protein n=1 Tax=Natronosalvus hydrolyticus TaxID=2979988 RepID=A0AAP2ZA56_9EURY|nr:hypothetical protein [Halobacteria archaeon AArc-curdl1]